MNDMTPVPFDRDTNEAKAHKATLIARANRQAATVAQAAKPELEKHRLLVNRLDHDLFQTSDQIFNIRETIRATAQERFFPHITILAFWCFAILILGLEVSANRIGLDQLRISPVSAWIIAVLIAMLSFVVSKYSGRMLAQRPWRDGNYVPIFIAFLSFALLIAVLWMIAQVRSLDPTTVGPPLFYFALQLAGYLAVLTLAYCQTDPNAAREQLTMRLDDEKRRFNSQLDKRLAVAQQHNQTLARALLQYETAMHSAQEAMASYWAAVIKKAPSDPAVGFDPVIPATSFQFMHLGELLDEQPQGLDDIISDPFRANRRVI
ncbi:hypothetical protein [Parasphingorhabdus sp.]|uniref:hypothetical protein n=1 Tax=Parasphingorhabdus sp. TaxID=2709688 RepID=UPI0035934F45